MLNLRCRLAFLAKPPSPLPARNFVPLLERVRYIHAIFTALEPAHLPAVRIACLVLDALMVAGHDLALLTQPLKIVPLEDLDRLQSPRERQFCGVEQHRT